MNSNFLSDIKPDILYRVEVRGCPLESGAGAYGVEVRGCPLQSGAGGGEGARGAALP